MYLQWQKKYPRKQYNMIRKNGKEWNREHFVCSLFREREK